MKKVFWIAGDGIVGGDKVHQGNLLIGKPIQDACWWFQNEEVTIGVGSDGCGSGKYSSLGSQLGAQLLVKALAVQWKRFRASCVSGKGAFSIVLPRVLEAARQDVIAHLRILTHAMNVTEGVDDASFSEVVNRNFLFTLLGTLITPYGAGFFGIGDGLVVVNGEEFRIPEYPKNEPPYIAHALFPTKWTDEQLRFVVHRCLKVEDLDSFLLGSDGAAHLVDAACETIPGSEELIGPLSQFWTDPVYRTKKGILCRLRLINSTVHRVHAGQLVKDGPRLPKDDVLIVVGGRK